MGHKSKKSLVRQVQEVLQAKLCPGDSKHMDKNTPEGTSAKLYSFGTYRTYMNVGVKFARFCKENHGCKTLDQCRQYVNEYLEQRGNSCSEGKVPPKKQMDLLEAYQENDHVKAAYENIVLNSASTMGQRAKTCEGLA